MSEHTPHCHGHGHAFLLVAEAEAAKVADTRGRSAAQNGKFGQSRAGAARAGRSALALVLPAAASAFSSPAAPIHAFITVLVISSILCRCAATRAESTPPVAPPRRPGRLRCLNRTASGRPAASHLFLTDDTTAVRGEHMPWTVMIESKIDGPQQMRRCAVVRQHQLLVGEGQE